MTKRKIVQTATEHLGTCVLFADDVAALVDILRAAAKPNDRILITVPGFALDDVADFESLDRDPSELTLRLVDAQSGRDVALHFWSSLRGNGHAPDTVAGRGVLSMVKAYLDKHCRPPFRLLYLLPAILVQGLAVWFSAPLGSPACDLIGVGTFLVVMWPSERLFNVFASQIHTTRRKTDDPPFWKRNQEKIATSIISTVIGGLIMLVVTTLLGRAKNVTLAEKRPSNLTSTAPLPGAAPPQPSASPTSSPPP